MLVVSAIVNVDAVVVAFNHWTIVTIAPSSVILSYLA